MAIPLILWFFVAVCAYVFVRGGTQRKMIGD